MFKKKTKVKAVKEKAIKAVKEVETFAKEETPVEHYTRLRNEAIEPLKKIEYQFWIDVHEGKNPEVPEHLRG